ncbi:MAG: hypothetical protein V1822_03435 [Candidatus Micrarchaeota archaeon]
MMSARAFGRQGQSQGPDQLGYSVDIKDMQKSLADYFKYAVTSYCENQQKLYNSYPTIEMVVGYLSSLSAADYRGWLEDNMKFEPKKANAYKNRAETIHVLASIPTYAEFFGLSEDTSGSSKGTPFFERAKNGINFLYFGYFSPNLQQTKVQISAVENVPGLSLLLLQWKKASEDLQSAKMAADAALSDKLSMQIRDLVGKIRKFCKENPQTAEILLSCQKLSPDANMASGAINADTCGSLSEFVNYLYIGMRALVEFSKNPSTFLPGFNFAESKSATSFPPALEDAESDWVKFPHEAKLNSIYTPHWISSAEEIAKNSIRTLVYDIIDAGKVWGASEAQIRAMCSFVTLSKDSAGNLVPGENSVDGLATKLIGNVGTLESSSLYNKPNFLADLLNLKLADGSYAVQGLREFLPPSLKNSDVSVSDLTKKLCKTLAGEINENLGLSTDNKTSGTGRYSKLGAEISYIMDARNTIANKEIIKNYVLIPFLEAVSKNSNSGAFKWEDASGLASLYSLLVQSEIELCAASRRTCEVPLPGDLIISEKPGMPGWDKQVLAALENQNILGVNYTNTAIEPISASAKKLMGDDVVSVCTFTNQPPISDFDEEFSINNFAAYVQAEYAKRKASRTLSNEFQDSYDALFKILTKVYRKASTSGYVDKAASDFASDRDALAESYTPFYYLIDKSGEDEIPRREFQEFLSERKKTIKKNVVTEKEDYATKNYLDDNRFTGVSAHVPQKLVAKTTPPALFNKDDANAFLNYQLFLQTRVNNGQQNKDVTSSPEVNSIMAVFSPNDPLEPGKLVSQTTTVNGGSVALNVKGLRPTNALETSKAKYLTKDTITAQSQTSTATQSVDMFTFDMLTSRTDTYYAYLRASIQNKDAKQLAGDSYSKIFPNAISEQMQKKCAGWTIDVLDTRNSKFTLERIGGGELFWYSQSVMPPSTRMGDTITVSSDINYVKDKNGKPIGIDFNSTTGVFYVGVKGGSMPPGSMPVYRTRAPDGTKLDKPELMPNISTASDLPAAVAFIGTNDSGENSTYYLVGKDGNELKLETSKKPPTSYWTVTELIDPQTAKTVGSVRSYNPPNKNNATSVIVVNTGSMLGDENYSGFIRHTKTNKGGQALNPDELSYKYKYGQVFYSATLDTSSREFKEKGASILNFLSSWHISYENGVDIPLEAVPAPGSTILEPKYILQYNNEPVFTVSGTSNGGTSLNWTATPIQGEGMNELGQKISPSPALKSGLLNSIPKKTDGGN